MKKIRGVALSDPKKTTELAKGKDECTLISIKKGGRIKGNISAIFKKRRT